MTHLGERLAALNLARVKESGITTAEKEILEENIPKSPGQYYIYFLYASIEFAKVSFGTVTDDIWAAEHC